MDQKRFLITRGGSAAGLDGASTAPHAIAPTPKNGDGFNTLAQQLRPVASWRIDSHRFETGSSFILPNGVDEFALLGKVCPPSADGEVALAELAVFGHADATGTDEQNKTLAGRRARSVYAMLVRDVDAWEELNANPAHSDQWGPRVLRIALASLGFPSGRSTNEWTDAGKKALRDFQSARGLSATGGEDKATRRELFFAYMDATCATEKGPLVYRPTDFLGHGQDPAGKAAYQGCGEMNPLVVPSKKRLELLNKPENHALRDEAYRNNRRVVIYAFPVALKITPERWPCPRAKEPGAGCKRMFWSDGDRRRQPEDRPREHQMQDGTFACRFYDRFARFSPSERTRRTIPVYLLDHERHRMPLARFRATFDGASVDGVADTSGRALIEGALASNELTLEWGARGGETVDFAYSKTLHLDPEDEPSDDEGRAALRLHNLGYRRENFHASLLAFQLDHGLGPNPWPDAQTRDLLYSSHQEGTEQDVEITGDGDASVQAADEPRPGEVAQ